MVPRHWNRRRRPPALPWRRLWWMLNRRALTTLAFALSIAAAQPAQRGNKPDGVELFRDRGLGLFVHWSVDAPLGGVISHSLVGASPDYVERFFRILPGLFNPDRFQPQK